jgi:TPR repeat protein
MFGVGQMRKASGLAGMVATILLSGAATALAGPWEDGMVAYNRGDYVPAMKLFRPLAQAGSAKAQNVLGVMYRKGEGVTRSSAKAFMWFSLAAKKGEPGAKAGLQEMTKEMTPADMTRASEIMAACEASSYRDCEY